MQVKFEKEGVEFNVDTATLPQVSIDYLLQYGFAQSMQDCIAGRAKAVRAETLEKNKNASEDDIDLAILSDIEGRLGKRFDAIKAGSVGVSAPRDPVATLAREQVRAALKGRKVDAEKLDSLVQAHVAKNRDALVAELARRKAAQVEVDLDI